MLTRDSPVEVNVPFVANQVIICQFSSKKIKGVGDGKDVKIGTNYIVYYKKGNIRLVESGIQYINIGDIEKQYTIKFISPDGKDIYSNKNIKISKNVVYISLDSGNLNAEVIINGLLAVPENEFNQMVSSGVVSAGVVSKGVEIGTGNVGVGTGNVVNAEVGVGTKDPIQIIRERMKKNLDMGVGITKDIVTRLKEKYTGTLQSLDQLKLTSLSDKSEKYKGTLSGSIDVICEGLMLGHSGFGKATRNYAYGLDKLGFNVRTIILDRDNIKSTSTTIGQRLLQMSKNTNGDIGSGKDCFWITMNYPLGVKRHDFSYNIAYIMFETLDFPIRFVNHLRLAGVDEIWTPSTFCKDSMERAGLKAIRGGVRVMPLGVDTNIFRPGEGESRDKDISEIVNFSSVAGKYKFLSVMGFSTRKGINTLVRAFSEEFAGKDSSKVALYLKGGWYPISKAWAEINIARSGIGGTLPLIHLDFSAYPENILANLYRVCDAFVLPSIGEGWCLSPDSSILTYNRGVHKIKDIKVGDKVLTHKGRFRRVNRVMKREYNGDMIKVNSYKLGTTILTPGHRVLGVKTQLCDSGREDRKDFICYPGRQCYYMKDGRQYKFCRHINGDEPYRKYKTEWINSDNLEKGDFVVYPNSSPNISPKNGEKEKKETDISKIRIIDYVDDILNITGDSYDDYSQQTDLFGDFVEKEIAMNNSYSIKNCKIPADIELTPDLMRLFGYFIAEGDIAGDRQLEFSFHANEIDYHKDVENLMKNIFGLDTEHVLKPEINVHVLRYSNRILSNMFQNMFCPKEYVTKTGKGSKSHIVRIPPEFINLPLEKLAGLIKGEWRGDGTDSHPKSFSILTTSETLALQLRYILSKFNILCSVNIRNGRSFFFDKSRERESIGHDSYNIEIHGKDNDIFASIINQRLETRDDLKDRNNLYLKGKNLYYAPIKDIETIRYEGEVWNLEVEEDNSYVSSIVVHNCMPCCEAMATGLPTIATRWSGMLEFMNDDVGYLIDVDKVGPEPTCDWITREYVGGKFGRASVKHLRQIMRDVYENRKEASEKGKRAREWMVQNYSWEVSCNRMKDRLEEIVGRKKESIDESIGKIPGYSL